MRGIKDILVIVRPEEKHLFKALLKDGSDWGISIQYSEQPSPKGIAQAFLIGKTFIGDDSVCLVLGDNIIYGSDMAEILTNAATQNNGATVFAYPVRDPQRYGVVAFNDNGSPGDIEEKPENPKSNFAFGKAALVNVKRQHPLSAEDALSRWH